MVTYLGYSTKDIYNIRRKIRIIKENIKKLELRHKLARLCCRNSEMAKLRGSIKALYVSLDELEKLLLVVYEVVKVKAFSKPK